MFFKKTKKISIISIEYYEFRASSNHRSKDKLSIDLYVDPQKIVSLGLESAVTRALKLYQKLESDKRAVEVKIIKIHNIFG